MVYKGLGCIEVGRVPHFDYVYFEAISKSNMKIERLRVLYDIKCMTLALKLYRVGI